MGQFRKKEMPGENAEHHYQAFLRYHDQGDLESALAEISEACRLNPGYAGSFGYLAEAYESRVRTRQTFGDEEANRLGVIGTDLENLRKAVDALNQFLEHANRKENAGRFEDVVDSYKSHLVELQHQLRSLG